MSHVFSAFTREIRFDISHISKTRADRMARDSNLLDRLYSWAVMRLRHARRNEGSLLCHSVRDLCKVLPVRMFMASVWPY